MPKKYILPAITLVIIGVAGLAIWWISIQNQGQSSPPATTKTIEDTAIRPLLVDTKDAYVRYLDRYTSGDAAAVKESNVHEVESIDWNSDILVALQFSTTSMQAFLRAELETVNGTKQYSITLRDAPQNCSGTTEQLQHIAFIKQKDRDTNYPVIKRIEPNPAKCDF